jgi:phage-related protein
MLLRWNGDGSRLIELTTAHEFVRDAKGGPKQDELGRPMSVRANPAVKVFSESILLGPGVNELSDAEWTLAKPHMILEGKAGLLKIMKLPATARKAGSDGQRETAKAITDLSVADAVKLVGQCGRETDSKGRPMVTVDRGVRDTLYRWLAEDLRENVQAAIMDRLVTLHFLAKKGDAPVKKDMELAKARLTFDGSAAPEFESEEESEPEAEE